MKSIRSRGMGTHTGIMLVIALVVAARCEAATIVKTNNTDSLNLGSSWVGGVVPGSTDVAKWDSTVVGANSVLLGADTRWQGLAVDSTHAAGDVTIGTGNTLTLGSSGISYIPNISLTLNCNVALATDQLWTLTTGFFNGPPIDMQGHTLTISGGSSKFVGNVTNG